MFVTTEPTPAVPNPPAGRWTVPRSVLVSLSVVVALLIWRCPPELIPDLVRAFGDVAGALAPGS